MDFAYRYTSSTLQDALHLASEMQASTGTGRGAAANNDLSGITLHALRLSVSSKTHYQFSPALPKEHFLELASEKNKVALPLPTAVVGPGGIRLPPERYCMTGVGFGMREEWESDGEEEVGVGDDGAEAMNVDGAGDLGEQGEADEDEVETMEDVFGGGGGAPGDDNEMGDG